MITFIIIIAICLLLWKITPNPANRVATGKMFQMLETFHLIDSTVKLDVFTKRLDFLGKLARSLPKNADKNKCIDTALHTYSQKYPAVHISPTVRLILNQPDIATSLKFRDEAYTAFYLRSCRKLKDEINTLKTATAKQRRVKQATDLADLVLERLKSTEQPRYAECINNELAAVSNMVS
ncbi:MAG: hypothetical protein HDQ88_07380 [Clostridia bacterium]|nr:hypothetical protein [Clostridia bacterium]